MGLYQPSYRDRHGELRKCKTWWYEYFDEHGIRQYAKLKSDAGLPIRDKGAAEIRAADLAKGLQLKRAGFETFDAARFSSPADLVKEYRQELERTKRNTVYVKTTIARLNAMLAGVASLTEMTSDRIARILGELAAHPVAAEKAIRKPERLSGRTQNFYRSALYTFFQWLVKAGRWPRNPVESVSRVDEDTEDDPALERRALEPEELLRFLAPEVLARRDDGRELAGVDLERGAYYAAVYDLAANSGLRRNELKTLRRAELDLEARIVTVLAKRAKSKKRRDVTLPASTCARLKAVLGEGKPEAIVFARGLPRMDTFYAHLGRAGIAADTEAGRVDFHALRTTFGTNLARSGATPAEAQRMLGHSDPRLTMRFYTKLRLHDQHAASARLEDFMQAAARKAVAERAADVARATGTDGRLGVKLGVSCPVLTDSNRLTAALPAPDPRPAALVESRSPATIAAPRRDGRAAECVGFENR